MGKVIAVGFRLKFHDSALVTSVSAKSGEQPPKIDILSKSRVFSWRRVTFCQICLKNTSDATRVKRIVESTLLRKGRL